MVSYIVEQVSGRKLPYNAAGIAERTRPIPSRAIQPGDWFSSTPSVAPSHIWASILATENSSTRPTVRAKFVDRLDNRYFAERFEGARTLMPEG
jgi:hypothetical protein